MGGINVWGNSLWILNVLGAYRVTIANMLTMFSI